jgi:transcriptional regulator with XRE-family HTH domain/tetratricopeptide (TPR) repeat protein
MGSHCFGVAETFETAVSGGSTNVITGQDLRAAREARGVGLGKLAERIGRSKGHLSKVERGVDDRGVTPALIRDYERALGMAVSETSNTDSGRTTAPAPIDERPRPVSEDAGGDTDDASTLAVSLPDSVALFDGSLLGDGVTGPWSSGALPGVVVSEYDSPTRSAVSSDFMKRRTLMKWGITATAAANVVGVSQGARQVGKVGMADVDRMNRAAARLRSLGHLHGGESLWQAATTLANDCYLALEHGIYSEAVGEQFQRAAGRIQMCAGWLAFDAGRYDVARACYNEALSLARQTADASTETHALVNLAFQSNALGLPRQALRFADAADRAAAIANDVGGLRTVPQLRRAAAFARAGDAHASDIAMTRARKALDHDANMPTAEWCTFISPAELDGVDATCAIQLGQASRAETLLERAVAGHTDRFVRNRALYKVRLASARLDKSAVDGAAEAANAALDDLSGDVASHVVDAELAQVAGRLAEHPTAPGVAAVLHRYAAARL